MISWFSAVIAASSASVISVIVSILPTVKLVVGIGVKTIELKISILLIVKFGLAVKTKVVVGPVPCFLTHNPAIISGFSNEPKLNAFLSVVIIAAVISWFCVVISASSAAVILISALSLRSIIKLSTIDEKLKNSEAYSLSLPSLIVKLGLATNINL